MLLFNPTTSLRNFRPKDLSRLQFDCRMQNRQRSTQACTVEFQQALSLSGRTLKANHGPCVVICTFGASFVVLNMHRVPLLLELLTTFAFGWL